jgi:hypothetical protein
VLQERPVGCVLHNQAYGLVAFLGVPSYVNSNKANDIVAMSQVSEEVNLIEDEVNLNRARIRCDEVLLNSILLP